jgi:transcriptional regulator with XRE-family HTH domain
MSLKKHADQLAVEFWASDWTNPSTIETLPSKAAIAFLVARDRDMVGWKSETLAGIARVNISTIERIERAEKVSDETLDKVAVALGRSKASFTAPRVMLNIDQALAFLEQSDAAFNDTIEVRVNPVSKQKQIRDLLNTHSLVVNDSGLSEQCISMIDELRDAFRGQISKNFPKFIDHTQPAPEPPKKSFYTYALAKIRSIERSAGAVALTGVYESECVQGDKAEELTFGYLGFYRKDKDLAASKRRRLFLPQDLRRLADFP